MDVDVYGGRVCLYINKIRRGHALGDEAFVGLHHGLVKISAAEIAAVDEEKLVSQSLPRAFRPADIAVDTGKRRLGPKLRQLSHDALAQHVKYPEFQGLGGLQGKQVAAVGR